MTLPYDIARCNGTTFDLCKSCRRTEEGRGKYQTMIAPAIDTSGCVNYIGHEAKFNDKGGVKNERD